MAARTAMLGALFAASLSGFLALGHHAEGRGALGWDEDVSAWIARHGLPENDVPANWSGRVGILAAVAILAILARQRRVREALLWAGGLGAAGLLSFGTKHLFERPSPDGVPLSYPSGHAFVSTVFVVLVVAVPWRAWVRALAAVAGLAIVVGLAMAIVKLHWHFASDVLGGWCAGLAWSSISLIAYQTSRAHSRKRRASD